MIRLCSNVMQLFSPEIINQCSSGISTATDVWSYAVVLWEMLTREIPYDGLTEFRIYSLIAEYGTKLVVPESCPERLTRSLIYHDYNTVFTDNYCFT